MSSVPGWYYRLYCYWTKRTDWELDITELQSTSNRLLDTHTLLRLVINCHVFAKFCSVNISYSLLKIFRDFNFRNYFHDFNFCCHVQQRKYSNGENFQILYTCTCSCSITCWHWHNVNLDCYVIRHMCAQKSCSQAGFEVCILCFEPGALQFT